MTRDIKEPGVCPACDRSREKTTKIVGAAEMATEATDDGGVKIILKFVDQEDEEFAITLDRDGGEKHIIAVMRALGVTTAMITDGAGLIL